jgi:hypothetical protein
VRDPAQLFDVLLAIEIDHELYRSHGGIRNKSFSLERDRRQRPAVEQRASFDEERELALRQPYDLTVVAPELREAAALESLVTRSRMQLIPLLRRALCA